MDKLKDNTFYFYRRDTKEQWRIGHVMIEGTEIQMFVIGRVKPYILDEIALSDYMFREAVLPTNQQLVYARLNKHLWEDEIRNLRAVPEEEGDE